MTDAPRFEGELVAARGGGATVVVPPAVAEALGPARRPAVRVTIGGHTFATRLAVYGGESMIGVSKANRAASGIEVGDRFAVEIVPDTAPRELSVPDDLAAALAADRAVDAAFARLSFTHRREYVEWVTGAKRPDTRARRIAGTLERVRQRAAG
jgi:Bacteriocin-protection, YdeI or OmpD-Associated/Domain of unknown function (DUF1905)